MILRASSDIDIFVDFIKTVGIGFVDLANFIEKKLYKKIDLVSRIGVKEKYFEQIESQIVYV
jgi:predicted nucleotidyltransferase